MEISSPAFEQHQMIPQKYTCQGEDLSPQLNFTNVPAKTKTIAIIVDDPDAPGGTFDHWIAWNLPPDVKTLKEGVKLLHQGKNHYNQIGYRGPCPPQGQTHRYFFKVYALDTVLDIPEGSSKTTLKNAMKGHILDHAELIGTYQKQ